MKNKSLILVLMLTAAVTSCSSYKTMDTPIEERKLASKEFECSFSDKVDGKKTMFIFTPDAMKLSMTNDKGSDVVFLEEDNFISGGFSFVMDKKQESKVWPVKNVEFISFATKPKVTVKFLRTPASQKEKVVTKFCE